MAGPFHSARLKLERAKEHIDDLYARGQLFADTHPHVLSVRPDAQSGNDVLSISPADPPPDELVLVLGDAIHNLKSALDHAWFQMIRVPNSQTKFPIRETQKDLEATVNGLKRNACEDLKSFIVDFVKPYRGGNGERLLELHNLDIRDKHSLLIVYRQFTVIKGIMAKNDLGEEFAVDDWLVLPPNASSRSFEGHSHFQITDKGEGRVHIAFGEGMPFQGRLLLPVLKNLTTVVGRIIECIETIHRANVMM